MRASRGWLLGWCRVAVFADQQPRTYPSARALERGIWLTAWRAARERMGADQRLRTPGIFPGTYAYALLQATLPHVLFLGFVPKHIAVRWQGIAAALTSADTAKAWSSWRQSPEPEVIPLPGSWQAAASPLQRLLLLRCLRCESLPTSCPTKSRLLPLPAPSLLPKKDFQCIGHHKCQELCVRLLKR